jgi:hypothetical protein
MMISGASLSREFRYAARDRVARSEMTAKKGELVASERALTLVCHADCTAVARCAVRDRPGSVACCSSPRRHRSPFLMRFGTSFIELPEMMAVLGFWYAPARVGGRRCSPAVICSAWVSGVCGRWRAAQLPDVPTGPHGRAWRSLPFTADERDLSLDVGV